MKLTDKEKKVIDKKQLIKDLGNMTTREVGKKYGWGNQNVYYYRRKFEITDFPRMNNASKSINLSEEERKDLKNLAFYQLKEKYGWNSSKINNLRTKYGVTNFSRMRKDKIPIPSVEELEGKTIRAVVKEYGVCRSTASRWFTERGITWKADERNKVLIKELEELKKENYMLRIAFVFPYLTNTEIGRAFGFSREYARQLRNKLKIPYINIDKMNFDLEKEENKENGN
jgi:transposase